jgi:hypothetical protein
MRAPWWLAGLSLVLGACGPEVGGRADLSLELSVFSSNDLLKVYAMSQDLKGGGKLSCSMLQSNQITFADTSLDILAEDSARADQLETGEVSLELTDIPAGEARVFAAEVVDLSSSARKGFGCTPNVTIKANKAVEVRLSVQEI